MKVNVRTRIRKDWRIMYTYMYMYLHVNQSIHTYLLRYKVVCLLELVHGILQQLAVLGGNLQESIHGRFQLGQEPVSCRLKLLNGDNKILEEGEGHTWRRKGRGRGIHGRGRGGGGAYMAEEGEGEGHTWPSTLWLIGVCGYSNPLRH